MALTFDQLVALGLVPPGLAADPQNAGEMPDASIYDFSGSPAEESDYPDYLLPEPVQPQPYDFRERLALGLQGMPTGMEPQRFESGGSAFARGLIGGLAGGFSRGTLANRQQKDVALEKENARREKLAEIHNRRAEASFNRRQQLKDAIALKQTPGATASAAPEKSLRQIEDEAAARARGTRRGSPPAADGGGGGGLFGPSPMQSQVDDIVGAIMSGTQPPDLKGLYRFGGPVRAGLAKKGYDYTKANLDWQAMQRWVATANGTQQNRLRQAANTAYESLDVVDELSANLSRLMPRGSVRAFNRATLTAAMNGAFGKEAQNVATQLDAQVTDIVSELGNVYMGGNSPTEEALRLAAKNLRSDWSLNQLKSATDLARRNLRIRINSISLAGPVTPNGPAQTGGGGDRVKVVGPKGEKGTVPRGAKLPQGWRLAE